MPDGGSPPFSCRIATVARVPSHADTAIPDFRQSYCTHTRCNRNTELLNSRRGKP